LSITREKNTEMMSRTFKIKLHIQKMYIVKVFDRMSYCAQSVVSSGWLVVWCIPWM